MPACMDIHMLLRIGTSVEVASLLCPNFIADILQVGGMVAIMAGHPLDTASLGGGEGCVQRRSSNSSMFRQSQTKV